MVVVDMNAPGSRATAIAPPQLTPSIKSAIVWRMDALTADDLETSRCTPPEQKLVQALEMADAGIRFKRAALRHGSPNWTEQDVDAALERWLLADG